MEKKESKKKEIKDLNQEKVEHKLAFEWQKKLVKSNKDKS